MSDQGPSGLFKIEIDESKVYLLRRKQDGKLYRIHHDGREEIEPEDPATKEQ